MKLHLSHVCIFKNRVFSSVKIKWGKNLFKENFHRAIYFIFYYFFFPFLAVEDIKQLPNSERIYFHLKKTIKNLNDFSVLIHLLVSDFCCCKINTIYSKIYKFFIYNFYFTVKFFLKQIFSTKIKL